MSTHEFTREELAEQVRVFEEEQYDREQARKARVVEERYRVERETLTYGLLVRLVQAVERIENRLTPGSTST